MASKRLELDPSAKSHTIDAAAVDKIVAAFGVDDKVARKAFRQAGNRTIRKMRTELKRRVAAALSIPQKAITPRLKVAMFRDTKPRGNVWLGLNPLPAHRLGEAAARPYLDSTDPKGFFITTKEGNRVAIVRMPNTERTRTGGRYRGRRDEKTAPVMIPIDRKGYVIARQGWAPANDFFLKEFARLLEVEVKKRAS